MKYDFEVTGTIGDDNGLTYEAFSEWLGDQEGDLHLMINSPGGYVSEGLAIYNKLADYPGRVKVTVNGIAASIASVILMAADDIDIYENSQVMIHNAWTAAVGDKNDFKRLVQTLEVLDSDLA